jgi:hypothetical protein
MVKKLRNELEIRLFAEYRFFKVYGVDLMSL